MENAESESIEIQAILRNMLRSVTALQSKVERLQAEKESLKHPTEEIIAKSSLSVESGFEFATYENQ